MGHDIFPKASHHSLKKTESKINHSKFFIAWKRGKGLPVARGPRSPDGPSWAWPTPYLQAALLTLRVILLLAPTCPEVRVGLVGLAGR